MPTPTSEEFIQLLRSPRVKTELEGLFMEFVMLERESEIRASSELASTIAAGRPEDQPE